MAIDTYKITQAQVNAVHMEAVVGDSLSGTVLQNKQRFDKYCDLIVEKFNDLCDYLGADAPEGDLGLSYTATEIAYICSTLGCQESDITM